jgi:Holliday junction resolvase RusA-like endonuclease
MLIEFPFLSPSVNSCYRKFGNRIIKSAKLRAFEQQCLHFFDKLEEEDPIEMIPVGTPICVAVHFYIKGNRSIDLDNLLKSLLDNLEGTVFENDNQIIEIVAHKHQKSDSSRMTVEINKA